MEVINAEIWSLYLPDGRKIRPGDIPPAETVGNEKIFCDRRILSKTGYNMKYDILVQIVKGGRDIHMCSAECTWCVFVLEKGRVNTVKQQIEGVNVLRICSSPFKTGETRNLPFCTFIS